MASLLSDDEPQHRVTIEVLVPEPALLAAHEATDPDAPLSAVEMECWFEAAVERCLRRGEFSIQRISRDDACDGQIAQHLWRSRWERHARAR